VRDRSLWSASSSPDELPHQRGADAAGNPRATAQCAEAPCDGGIALPVRCPVCDASDISQPRCNLSLCRRCQHIFQTDLVVSAVYDAAYAHQYDLRPHKQMSALRWSFIQRWLALAAGSRILDIGYGNGSLLKHARQCGMEVYGLDVHSEDFGIPTVSYRTTRTFDLVCFFDSLEHFAGFDPLFGLRTSNIVVSLPAPPDFLLESPQHWRHYKPGEHLHHFSPESLDFLMGKWGLRRKVASGFPEDALRGKWTFGQRVYDNIYTAIYSKGESR
jgi:SAM-dependent methyltransferase